VLEVLRTRWPDGCFARDVAAYAGNSEEAAIEFKAVLEQASGKPIKLVTATTISWQLKALQDAPVQTAGGTFVLRYQPHNMGGKFIVEKVG
jgi:hypothetical protein